MKKIKHSLLLIAFLIMFPLLLPAQQNYFSKVHFDQTSPVRAWSCAMSYDNHYFIAGEKDGNGLLIKADSEGNIVWSKTIDNTSHTNFNHIIPTADSCFLLVGQCLNFNSLDIDLFYCKINSPGDTLWTGSVDFSIADVGISASQTSDKGFIISGISYSSATAPFNKILLCKLDSTGNVTWTKKITGGNYNNYIMSVKQTPDGGYIATGYIEDTTGSAIATNTFLIKLFADGTIDWAKPYKAPIPTDKMYGYDVVLADNGFTVLAGLSYSSRLGIFHTDSAGNILWSRNYQVYTQTNMFNEFLNPRLHNTRDNGYVFATSGQYPGQSFIKTNAMGIPLWSKNVRLGTTDVLETRDSAFLLVGNGPLYGIKNKFFSNYHIGIIKTDSADNSFNNCNYDITISFDTLLITVGAHTFNSISAGVSSATHHVVSSTSLSETVGCVDVYGSVDENTAENTLLVYPNPFSQSTHISFSQTYNNIAIEVFNLQGQLVAQNNYKNSNSIVFERKGLSEGMYFLKLRLDGKKVETRKIIISE